MCRRAQRKFRERQKQKLADSEGKATELRKELEQLRVEKSKLETRNALLERLITMKGSGAKSTVSDRDSAREETPRHATQGSQMVHLTVREGGAFFQQPGGCEVLLCTRHEFKASAVTRMPQCPG